MDRGSRARMLSQDTRTLDRVIAALMNVEMISPQISSSILSFSAGHDDVKAPGLDRSWGASLIVGGIPIRPSMK